MILAFQICIIVSLLVNFRKLPPHFPIRESSLSSSPSPTISNSPFSCPILSHTSTATPSSHSFFAPKLLPGFFHGCPSRFLCSVLSLSHCQSPIFFSTNSLVLMDYLYGLINYLFFCFFSLFRKRRNSQASRRKRNSKERYFNLRFYITQSAGCILLIHSLLYIFHFLPTKHTI